MLSRNTSPFPGVVARPLLIERCVGLKGGSGVERSTLCHDIYPARPITTVSLAANTYCMMDGHSSCAPRTVGPRVQFSGACERCALILFKIPGAI